MYMYVRVHIPLSPKANGPCYLHEYQNKHFFLTIVTILEGLYEVSFKTF